MKQSFEQFITNQQIQENYNIAQKAFAHTLDAIKGSSNRLSQKEVHSEYGKKIIENINKMREVEISEPLYSLEWIQKVAELAEIYQVGNCCEQGDVTFNYLYESMQSRSLIDPPNVELFNNPFVDHFFVVLARDLNTDPNDPRT